MANTVSNYYNLGSFAVNSPQRLNRRSHAAHCQQQGGEGGGIISRPGGDGNCHPGDGGGW